MALFYHELTFDPYERYQMHKRNLFLNLVAASLTLSLCACSSTSTADSSDSIDTDSWVYKNLSVLESSNDDQSMLSAFNALFDQSAQGFDYKMEIESTLNGNKLNFINMDDIFSSDSIFVDDYNNTRKFYQSDENVYEENLIADDTLSYSLSTADTFYSVTGVASDDLYTVILSDETQQELDVSSLARQFLAAPMIVQPLMQETVYISPLEQPTYFNYVLKADGEKYTLTISIKNADAFNKKNRDLMEASGVNTEFLEKIEVSEDTIVLTMSADGILSHVEQTSKVNYVDGDESAKQDLKLSAEMKALSDFDTAYVDDLFANTIEISKTTLESK
jgi:hypothetical protein